MACHAGLAANQTHRWSPMLALTRKVAVWESSQSERNGTLLSPMRPLLEVVVVPAVPVAEKISSVGCGVGTGVGSGVGRGVGLGVGCGVGRTGEFVGATVGNGVGHLVGHSVGRGVGTPVGHLVGARVGATAQLLQVSLQDVQEGWPGRHVFRARSGRAARKTQFWLPSKRAFGSSSQLSVHLLHVSAHRFQTRLPWRQKEYVKLGLEANQRQLYVPNSGTSNVKLGSSSQ